MEHVISEYVASLGIPVSRSYCEKCMVSHPDYPSLLSAADTLERLGIEHQTGKIEKENLGEVAFPYMLHLKKGQGTFLHIRDRHDLEAHQNDMEHWDGVILKAKPAKSIANEQNNKQLKQEKLQHNLGIALGTTLLGLFLLSVIRYGSWLNVLFFATALTGAAIGYLLMAKDIGITYKPVEAFCNAGKRTNCDRILHAKDARLFSFFTFTDATASYFAFQLLIAGLFIPLFKGSASFFAALAAAGLLTIPVIGYSLYYQYVKAQTWCRLCLIVDAVLAVQLAIYITLYYRHILVWDEVQLWAVGVCMLLFGAVASSVILLKNRLQTANASSREETAAKRVKHDPEVFTHLLLQEEPIDITPFEQEIRLGNPQALVQILMVANLHCNPCRIAYETVTQLLAAYPEKVCFAIRLTRGMREAIGELSASTYLIRYWQHHIHGQKEELAGTQALLQHWYEDMDPEVFARRYPSNGELHAAPEDMEPPEQQHDAWIKEQDIKSTPTFFVNGYRMPQHYTLHDLRAMLPGLAAWFNKRKNLKNKTAKSLLKKQEG